MTMHDLATRIEHIDRLDVIAKPLGELVKRLIPNGRRKDVLSGTWLGHPLHPLLTDIPIGSFTSATILDLIGGRRLQPAANLLAGIGVVSVAPTAAAGFADWSDTYGPGRRIGVVHAAANVVGVGFYTASIMSRRHGKRFKATVLGLMGMGVMSVGGYLGGHLTFVRGVGVNRTFMEDPSREWRTVTTDDQLREGTPMVVDIDDVVVLLYRTNGIPHAISNICSHAGGPLDQGTFDSSSADGVCVTCPWHQSVFRVEDGSVVHGPATVPQPTYKVRSVGGKIEVRAK